MKPTSILILSFRCVALLCCIAYGSITKAQTNNEYWHGIARTMHYKPQGNDIVLVKGTRKFNRALYGTNTAFRVETGDLPEFALYMPGMGGNCKIGFVINNKSKWLTECDSIQTIYRAGSMLYEIRDSLLHDAVLHITVLALADAEGMVLQLQLTNATVPLQVIVAYGGASGKKFSRDGDIGADPESSFYLQPAYCTDNIFTINKNSFQLQYGFTKPLTDDERYEIQYKPTIPGISKDAAKQMQGIFPINALLQLADANQQQSPLTLVSSSSKSPQPLITASFSINNNVTAYFLILHSNNQNASEQNLSAIFNNAETARKKLPTESF